MRRISFFTILFVLSYWSVSFAIDAPTDLHKKTPFGDFDIPRSASRTSGVAPLSVFFVAGFSPSSPTERDFHNYEYSWNFGDPESGTWGTTKKPKDEAKGPVAAHVYEMPGNYIAILTIRDASGVVDTDSFNITVSDPDIVYSGTNTTCVSDTTQNDFTGCPDGARQIATDNLSTITQYAGARQRVLFHRGSSWTSSGLDFPDGPGPTTLGAYGTCTSPDDLGICNNEPKITISGNFCDLDRKQNWRFMDLNLIDPTTTHGTFGGASDMQRVLFLRLNIDGFFVGLGWSHWNDSTPMTIDQMVIADCDIVDCGEYGMYIGGERIAIIGTIVADSGASHLVRVWQAYKSVISNNRFSGANLDNKNGRACLKFHGPTHGTQNVSPVTPRSPQLANRSEFTVISENVFGSSGPWSINIGPQDAGVDERLSDIIFERNAYFYDFGSKDQAVMKPLNVWGRYISVRNNIIDVSSADNIDTYGPICINVARRGVEATPLGNMIYNNTIYRSDGHTDAHVGIRVTSDCDNIIVRNNLISFPNVSGSVTVIDDGGRGTVSSNNLEIDNPYFVNPNNANPLLRNFSLQSGSSAIGSGVPVPVYEDYYGKRRTQDNAYDIGAIGD